MNQLNTYSTATPPQHVPSLLEQSGIGVESTADQYCEAIHRHCNLNEESPYFLDERQMFSAMSQRKIIPDWSMFAPNFKFYPWHRL